MADETIQELTRVFRLVTIEAQDTGYLVGLRDGRMQPEEQVHAFSTKEEALLFARDRLIRRAHEGVRHG